MKLHPLQRRLLDSVARGDQLTLLKPRGHRIQVPWNFLSATEYAAVQRRKLMGPSPIVKAAL